MKSIPNKLQSIIILCLILSISLGAQTLKPIAEMVHNNPENKKILRIFKISENNQALEANALKTVTHATIATLDLSGLQNMMRENESTLSVSIPYENTELVVDLVQVPNLTEDFVVRTSISKGLPVTYDKGHYYRGIVRGDDESIVAISFFKNEVIGMISTKTHRNIVIGRLEKTNNSKDYIIYSDKDLMIENNFECGADKTNLSISNSSIVKSEGANVGGCVRVYFELDFGTFVNRGSRANAVNYITACFNNVAALYQNEMISTTISEIFVWETPDSYPVGGGSAALNAIKSARPTFNGDLAHLVSIRTGSSFSGIAWLFTGSPYTVLCSEFKYAYSQTSPSFNAIPTYSWTIEVLTHEMGHNMGSPHTQSCTWPGGAIDGCVAVEGSCARPPVPPPNTGTIMSYCHQVSSVGINFSLGFGPLPGDRIRTAIQSVNCLNSTCTALCTAPGQPTPTNITTNSALIGWGAIPSAQSYTVEYKTSASVNWTSVNIATNSLTLTNLLASTVYNVRVYTVCSPSSSSSASPIANFTTTGAGCTAPELPNVSNITSNGALVSWTAIAGAQSYKVDYKLNTSLSWTSLNTSSNSINLTGLSSSSIYNVIVYTNCSSTTSSGSPMSTFTTTASVCIAPLQPTVSNITVNSAFLSWNAVSGAQSYRVEYKRNSDLNWLSQTSNTNNLTLSGLSSVTAYVIRVYTICSSSSTSPASPVANFTTIFTGCPPPSNLLSNNITNNSASISWSAVLSAQQYRVQYKTLSSQNWTTINTNSNSIVITGLNASTTYEVQIITVCTAFSSSVASPKITFTTLGGGCLATDNLNISNITANGSLISWNTVSGAQSYRIEYKATTEVNWSITNSNSNSITLSGLAASTTYNVRVITICSASSSSNASPTADFTTLAAPCNAPQLPTISNITLNSALVSWNAISGAQSYRVEYKTTVDVNWASVNSNSNSITLSGLAEATAYNVRIVTICSATSSSSATPTANFTTLVAPCNATQLPTTSNLTSNTALISWNVVSGSQSYKVEYKTTADVNWTSVNSNTNSITLLGLASATTYNVRIITICSASSSSAASPTANFTTLIFVNCTNSYEPNNSFFQRATIPVNTPILSMISNFSDNDYYSFSTTNSAPKIKVTLSNLPFNYDMRLFKVNSGGGLSLISSSNNTGITNEVITYNTETVSGNYAIQVYGVGGAFSNTLCYNLLVNTSNTAFPKLQSFSTSDIAEKIFSINLSPNPTKESVNIRIESPETGEYLLTFIDMIGKIHHTQKHIFNEGDNYLTVDIKNIPPGVYFVKAQNQTQQVYSKLMIQR